MFGFACRSASILHCSRIFWAQGSPAWSIFQCSLGNASWQWCSSWRLQIKCSGLFEFILKHWRILRAFWLYFTWHILFGIGVQHATSFNYTMKLAACWFLSNVHRTYIVSFLWYREIEDSPSVFYSFHVFHRHAVFRQRLQKYYELWKCNNCRFCLRAFFVGQRYIPTETLGTASIEACHGVRLTTQKLALKWALKCRRDGKYSSPHLAWYLTTRRGSKFLSRRCFGSRSLLLHCYIHCYRERNLMEPLFLENPIAV